ncbi:hypothetical protein [Pelotomaculum sp. FP]|nr:hypothetical protein [Pelotomaculum sp. FP]
MSNKMWSVAAIAGAPAIAAYLEIPGVYSQTPAAVLTPGVSQLSQKILIS